MSEKRSVKLFDGLMLLLAYLCALIATANGNQKVDEKIKKMVEEAGCTYASPKQLLVRNVCLMPDYQSNELPNNANGVTKVDFYLQEALVLEVDEKKDKLTVKLSQLMEWGEPRLRANFSTISEKFVQIKLSPKNIRSLWHPDLDMYTKDLEEWKSLYDPLLFQEVVVSERAFLHHYAKRPNVTSIHVWKDWIATFYCKFDFSTFPLDKQQCNFRQMGTSQTIIPLLYPSLNIENWKYRAGGFQISISPVGVADQHNLTLDTVKNAIGCNITLERIVHPYLYQYYFPCMAIVVVSQISFIIPVSAIPGRVALVVTQFLTLTNIFIHLMADSPSGPSLNALGFYLLVSLFFVIATMVEFAFVLMVSRFTATDDQYQRHEDKMSFRRSNHKSRQKELIVVNNLNNGSTSDLRFNENLEVVETSPPTQRCYLNPNNIDFGALLVFFSSYVIFNCVYMLRYV